MLCLDSFWRCLADSNCCRRFCRPLTKPLIQGTLFVSEAFVAFADAKVQLFFCSAKFFRYFFLLQAMFLLICDFRVHPEHPSHGSFVGVSADKSRHTA